MKRMNFLNLPNFSSRTRPCCLLGLWQKLVPIAEKCFGWVECGQCVRQTTLPPCVSRLPRECEILNISQPYRPPWLVTGIALPFFTCPKILSDDLNISHFIQHSASDQRAIAWALSVTWPIVIINMRRFSTSSWQEKKYDVLCRILNWSNIRLPGNRHNRQERRQDRSVGKAMLQLFVVSSGIIEMQFISEGATLNNRRYKKFLLRPHNLICHKRPEL
jgi:hypothetical protein